MTTTNGSHSTRGRSTRRPSPTCSASRARSDGTRSSCAGSTSRARRPPASQPPRVLDEVKASGLPVACVGVELGWMGAAGDERRRLLSVFEESCRWAVALGCADRDEPGRQGRRRHRPRRGKHPRGGRHRLTARRAAGPRVQRPLRALEHAAARARPRAARGASGLRAASRHLPSRQERRRRRRRSIPSARTRSPTCSSATCRAIRSRAANTIDCRRGRGRCRSARSSSGSRRRATRVHELRGAEPGGLGARREDCCARSAGGDARRPALIRPVSA